MHPYGVGDVEKLLHLPRSTIRALIAAGFVSPARGPRKAWLFSFQDLIVLRTAQTLADAKVPPRRITKSVRELRRHLPDAMPLSGLSICAVADRVVVREGGNRWQAESGQYLLAFEGDPAEGTLNVIERAPAAEPSSSSNSVPPHAGRGSARRSKASSITCTSVVTGHSPTRSKPNPSAASSGARASLVPAICAGQMTPFVRSSAIRSGE